MTSTQAASMRDVLRRWRTSWTTGW